MSLTTKQMNDTKKELQANWALAQLTLLECAQALDTTPEVIENTLQLTIHRIEDPWILKNYLEEKLTAKGKESVPFTALVGDYHNYWFLDTDRIDQRKLG